MIKGEKSYEYIYKYKGEITSKKNIKDSREKQIAIKNNLTNTTYYRKHSNVNCTNVPYNMSKRNNNYLTKKNWKFECNSV